jgi:uroporphyrinogen-III synthase
MVTVSVMACQLRWGPGRGNTAEGPRQSREEAMLVLTRPAAQSRALADGFAAAARVVISPVMKISGTGAAVDLTPYTGVILTSANAGPFLPDLGGVRAFCVGDRTARVAEGAGAEIGLVARNADGLVARIAGPGPLIHLRGQHARGQIAERMNSAGIETHEAVVYRQEAVPLTAEAVAAIESDAPVVLPLYSPRSAQLVAQGVKRVGSHVRVIAMSGAVAEAWASNTGGGAEVCSEPTGAAMRARIEAALRG